VQAAQDNIPFQFFGAVGNENRSNSVFDKNASRRKYLDRRAEPFSLNAYLEQTPHLKSA
jgi:hypothetical protein